MTWSTVEHEVEKKGQLSIPVILKGLHWVINGVLCNRLNTLNCVQPYNTDVSAEEIPPL